MSLHGWAFGIAALPRALAQLLGFESGGRRDGWAVGC